MTFTWCSKDMFDHMLKAEFVALVSLKVPSGHDPVSVQVCKDARRLTMDIL